MWQKMRRLLRYVTGGGGTQSRITHQLLSCCTIGSGYIYRTYIGHIGDRRNDQNGLREAGWRVGERERELAKNAGGGGSTYFKRTQMRGDPLINPRKQT